MKKVFTYLVEAVASNVEQLKSLCGLTYLWYVEFHDGEVEGLVQTDVELHAQEYKLWKVVDEATHQYNLKKYQEKKMKEYGTPYFECGTFTHDLEDHTSQVHVEYKPVFPDELPRSFNEEYQTDDEEVTPPVEKKKKEKKKKEKKIEVKKEEEVTPQINTGCDEITHQLESTTLSDVKTSHEEVTPPDVKTSLNSEVKTEEKKEKVEQKVKVKDVAELLGLKPKEGGRGSNRRGYRKKK